METTLDRSVLFDAATCGDLDMIHCYFHHPAAQALISNVNRLLRTVYTTALEANRTPYINTSHRIENIDNAWFIQLSSCGRWHHPDLFEELVKRRHVHILKWFFGEEAYPIVGDTIGSILNLIFWPALYYEEVASEVTEMILTSFLYYKMSPADREIALSMMLHSSIDDPSPSVIRLLIAHGASLVDPTEVLAYCAEKGNGSTAQMLVDCGVFGVSHQVLDQSAHFWTVGVAQVFVNNGMDVHINSNEFNPLHLVAKEGVAEMVEIFVVQGFADVNAQDSRGMTPLMAASGTNNYGYYGRNSPLAVKILLEYGALVNHQDESGQTSLHYAAESEYFEVISALLDKGADPNIQDSNLDTPLHMVARQSEQEDYVARLDALLSKGANPRIPNSRRETPLDILIGFHRGREFVERRPDFFGNRGELAPPAL